jgi:hypothetical protein
MPDLSDISAEEILREMIRDRIGSADPEDIELAEDFRKYMDGLSAVQRTIDMLEEAIRLAGKPGEFEHLTTEGVAQVRELITQCMEMKSAMEALIVDPVKEGYERGYKHGWEEATAGQVRKQMLATVTDLTSRLRG